MRRELREPQIIDIGEPSPPSQRMYAFTQTHFEPSTRSMHTDAVVPIDNIRYDFVAREKHWRVWNGNDSEGYYIIFRTCHWEMEGNGEEIEETVRENTYLREECVRLKDLLMNLWSNKTEPDLIVIPIKPKTKEEKEFEELFIIK